MLIGTLQHEEYFFINQEVGDNFNQQVDSGMDMTTESTPFTSRYSDNLTRPPFDFSKQVGWNLGSVAVFLATTRHWCIVVDEFAPTVYLSSSSSSGLNLNWCCPKAVPRMMSRWFYFSIVCNRLFPLIACIKLLFVHCLHQTFLCSLLTLNSTRLRWWWCQYCRPPLASLSDFWRRATPPRPASPPPRLTPVSSWRTTRRCLPGSSPWRRRRWSSWGRAEWAGRPRTPWWRVGVSSGRQQTKSGSVKVAEIKHCDIGRNQVILYCVVSQTAGGGEGCPGGGEAELNARQPGGKQASPLHDYQPCPPHEHQTYPAHTITRHPALNHMISWKALFHKLLLIAHGQELQGQDEDNQLPFDPDDPKVKELEELMITIMITIIILIIIIYYII